MKTSTQLSICFAGLILSFVCLAGEPSPQKAPCCSKADVALAPQTNTPLSDVSLYQVDSTWITDAGEATQLASLRGRPQIITMFFARCEYACPALVYNMQRIEKALPEALRSKVGFTLVSFDTERDSVEVLHKYRINHQLNDRWTLLRGNSDDVLELAALLGVKFKKDERGQFAHSNVITILNSDGEVAFQQFGLNHDPQAMSEVVQKLFPAASN